MVKSLRLYAGIAGMLLSAISSFGQSQPDHRCGTMYTDSVLRAQHPEMESAAQFEEWMESQIASGAANRVYNGVYQIPVVVHVIHAGEAIGTGTNVSQAAIQSQIDVLNEDYRRMFGTNGWNDNPVGADCQIEFCLAQRRPDGSAFAAGAPGVNRIHYTSISGVGSPPFTTNTIDNVIKPYTYNGGVATATQGWDPNKYLNLWLCDLGQQLLGYAQFPSSPLGGMGCTAVTSGTMATDGVVFLYSSIGKSAVTGFTGQYAEGRTVTHEVGHWLGLRHIWGDGDCTYTDYCNDTPTAAAPNYMCPTGINTCTTAPDQGPDMVQNYMDYTDDLCMNIFTQDQKARMRAVLEGSPLRINLINSDACTPPNPSDGSIVDIFNPKGDNCPGATTPSVQLRNRGANNLTSATISYQVDNGSVVNFNWTGTVAPGSNVTVSLPAFTTTYGSHFFKSWSSLPNGVTDPFTLYDTSSIPFIVSAGIVPNYTEDFEAETFPPDLRWNIVNTNSDCFEWTAATGTSSTGVFANNIAEVPCYGNGSTSPEYLYTPIFTLPCGATNAKLNFNVAYRRRNTSSTDALSLEISTDCGSTYTQIWTASGSALAQNTTTTGNSEFFPAAATDWKAISQSIQTYVNASTSSKVRFRFKGVSSGGNNIFIDNVAFLATLGAEAEVSQNGNEVFDEGAFDFGQLAPGSSVTKTFTVSNQGASSLTITPPAVITGTGFSVNATFGATTIPAGGSTTISLTFTPNAVGSFTGNFSFANSDCDEGAYNFALTGQGVSTPPVAAFTASPLVTCVGMPVSFTNTSTNAATYSWTFGASATPSSSTLANPIVSYTAAGTYPVTLVATNSNGSTTQTLSGYITVLAGAGTALPLTEGFTTTTFPPTGWSVVNPDGSSTWARSGSVGRAPTAGNSMFFNNYSINDMGNEDEVHVKPLNFGGYSAVTLTFDVAYSPRTVGTGVYYSDDLEVLISNDCGATFNSVYLKGYTDLATAATVSGQFTPTTSQWRTETISLSTYAGDPNVVIAFRNIAGHGNRLFIDNINVSGTAAATPVASFTASPTTVCAGSQISFTNTSTNSPTTYSWTFAGGTPATSTAENPVVTYSTPGTYTVAMTATNAAGNNTATHTNSITVNAIPSAPTISAGGPTTICTGGNVTLTASPSTGVTWSTGQTTASITVNAAGTYSATTTTNGCTSPPSVPITVTVNSSSVTPTFTNPGPVCAGTPFTLPTTSDNGITGTWSPAINNTTTTTYTFTPTAGQCASTTTMAVTVNPAPATPVITPGGPTTFCTGGNVVLTSSAATGNTWSTGATTQSITVSSSGTYTTTVTSGGCSAISAGTSVTVNPTPATPVITAGGPTTFCSGGNVVLTSSASTGNTWSTGETTQSITVSSSGTYTTTVTSGGCSAISAGTSVTVNPTPATPVITAGGPTTFCSGGNVVLTSSAAAGNTWTTGETTQSITVSSSGTYTTTVTSGGCSAISAGTSVTVNPTPATPIITANGPTTFCSGGNVVLTSSAATGNAWSTGETTQSITVSSSGTYTVTVTSGSCSAISAGTSVTVNPTPATPIITANGPTTFCSGGNVVLTSSAVTGNAWSTGETTQSITVSSSGTYTTTVTSGSCSAISAGTSVTVNPTPATPVITPGGPTTFCSGGNVVLTSSAAAGNTWSTGETTQSITVSSSGTYTTTVTSGGCSAISAGTSVTVNPTPATPVITAGGPTTFCSGGNVVLTSSAATGNAWSTGETTQSITVSSSGTYTVTVTSGSCPATSAGTAVSVSTGTAPATFAAVGPYCSGDSFTLPATSIEGFTGTWSPAVNNTATTTYTFAVNSGQCASDGSLTVTINNPTPATFAAQGPYCPGTTFTLPATSNEGFTGTWSPAIDNMSTTTYAFTVDAGQCAQNGTSTVTITPIATPTVTAGGATTFCSGGNVVLTSSAASGNTWSNGETSQSITVTNPGTYTVAVTSGSCTSNPSNAVTVTVNPSPTVSFGAIPMMCVYNDPVTLTQGVPAGGAYTGSGVSGGMFDPSVAGLGTTTITYTVTGSNGCSSAATSTVQVGACLGLGESVASVLSVYPNPTSGLVTVDAGKATVTEIVAYDALGKLLFVMKPNATATQINLSGYASGVYNLKITTDSGVQHVPVSVNY